jgi:FAD/FMN-containing dehydrogenase
MSRVRTLATAALATTAGVVALRVISARRARAQRKVWSEHADAAIVDDRHHAKVDSIIEQLRSLPAHEPVSLHKAGPPHSVPKWKDLRREDTKVDISTLTEILEIDPIAKICVAESGAMFEDVVEATLLYGLVPMVVPEFKSITIGGAVTGCSIESTSFKYGGFHDGCLAYEVITARGEVLHLTPHNEHALEFQMMQSSFGTLGILAKLVFKLVPAQPYVKLEYERHSSVAAYREAILAHSRAKDFDFIDGFIHGPRDFVLALGRYSATAPYAHRYDWMRVFYVSTKQRDEDYLRTQDYFFRYDRGVTSVTPSSWLGRLALGKVLDSKTTLQLANALHDIVLDKERPTITLDVFIPISKLDEFLAWYEREFEFFPLWMVPYKRVHDYEWLADSFYKGLADEWFVDLAIYGMKPQTDKPYHQLMEAKLRELGGVKTLISHNYYTPEEFWRTWNKRNYDAAKAVLDPDNLFRDLYTKTCKAAMGVES